MSIFKDVSITSNGRYRIMNDVIFEEIMNLYSSSSDDVKLFLREKIFAREDGALLSFDNKQRFEYIKYALPNTPLCAFLESEITRFYNLKLGETTKDDKVILDVYIELLSFLKTGENYEWLVYRIISYVKDFRYYAPNDYIKLRIYKNLISQFNLELLLTDKVITALRSE